MVAAMQTGGKRVLAIAVAVMLAVLAWAWIDGGAREVQPMVDEVSVPESAK